MLRLGNHAIAHWVSSIWVPAIPKRELYCRTRAVVVYDRTLNMLENR